MDVLPSPCQIESVGEVAFDQAGLAGVSPAAAIDTVDGSSFNAVFRPMARDLGPDDQFDSTVEVLLSSAGVATEENYDGQREFAVGGDSPTVCPVGPLMTVPVLATVQLGVGGWVTSEATLVAMGAELDQLWLNVPLLPAADWDESINTLAAEVVDCADCELPITIRMGLVASPFMEGTSWATPKGGMDLIGVLPGGGHSDDGGAFFDFDGAWSDPLP